MNARGIRRLVLLATAGAAFSLASAPDARADVAGINMGAPVWEGVAAEEALQASIATGAHYVRVNFRLDQWSSPSDPTLHDGKTWFQVYDHIVDAITSRGLEVYGLLSDELTTGFGRADYTGAAFEDAYARNALAVIDRYKDRVRVFETINEPNDWAGGTSARIPAAAFARLHARVYDDAKRAHATDACWDVTLVTGPLFSFDDSSSADYLDAVIAAGRPGGRWKAVRDALGHDPIDGIGYHLYVAQGTGSPASDVAGKGGANLDAIGAVLAKYGISGPKTWVSEIGWKVPDVDEATQAARVDTTYATLGGRGDVASLQWFTIQDFPGNDWGLFTMDGFAPADARPAYAKFVAQARAHAPALAARLTIDVPATVAVGSTVVAHVTATNLGKTAWTRALDVRLGAAAGCPSAWAVNGFRWADVDAADGYTKAIDDARRYLPATATVPQGSDVKFDVVLAAPTAPGKLRVAARMVREGVAWFGSTVYADVDVTGTPIPGSDAAADASSDVAIDAGGRDASSPDSGPTTGGDDGGTDREASEGSSGCGCRVAQVGDEGRALRLLVAGCILLVARRRRPGAR